MGVKPKSDEGTDQIKAALSGPVETSSLAKFRQIIEEKRRSSCDILSKLQMELSEAQISAIDGKIDYIKYQLSKMQEYITLQEDTLVLNWISTVTMDEQQKTQRNAAERDGRGNQKPGDWMLREREYVTWNDSASEESRTLWLSGEVGTGKSIVTSTVVKDCQGDYGKEIYGPTAYFYCSGIPGNSQKEVNAEDILRSILRQLVQWSEATIDVARAQWVLLQRRMQTQFEVEDLIKQIVSHEETLEATIIIDGLDELTTSCLNDLLTSLEVLMAAKGTVKIFLASRPLSQVARCLSNIRGSEVVITPAHTEENMAFYIDTTITAKTKRIESKYITGDLDARIRKLLTDSARGV
jgi:hypothetical protein